MDKAELQISEIFGTHVTFAFNKISIDPAVKSEIEKEIRQRFFRSEVYAWKVSLMDTLQGYVLHDNVLGKSMPITFLVAFDTAGIVIAARVVKYREAYGGAISNYNWLDQFKKTSIVNYSKNNIDAISGATISVNAIKKKKKKLTLLFPFIQKKIN